MQCGVCTDIGLKREVNEDYCGVLKDEANVYDVFVVADGMGGHQAGEVASKMSVELVLGYIREGITSDMSKEEVGEKLKEIIKKVNSDIHDVADKDPGKYGMGTTMVVVVDVGMYLVVANVGDSRLYYLKDNKLKRLTVDHSYVEELIQKGTITEEEAKEHPRKNVLTRVVGYFKEVDADIYECELKGIDKFLMCTDGLTNMVSDGRIAEILADGDNLQDIAKALVSEANKNGGIDNTTVIVLKDGVAVDEG